MPSVLEFSSSKECKVLVIDDHPSIITGTIEEIKKIFPHFESFTATNVKAALEIVNKHNDFELAVVDLRIPNEENELASSECGLNFLKTLMSDYPTLNIIIQTSDMSALISILTEIESHDGGLVIAPKSLSSEDIRKRIAWAIDGITYTKDFRKELNISNINMKPSWYKVLRLAFEESLIDSEIASRMSMSEPNIRRIWEKIYDALDVEREKGTNLRIKTYNRVMQLNYIKPPS